MSDLKSIKNKLSSLRAKVVKSEPTTKKPVETTETTTTSTPTTTTTSTPKAKPATTTSTPVVKAPVETPAATTTTPTSTTPVEKKNNNKKAKQQKKPKAEKKTTTTNTTTEAKTTTPTETKPEQPATTTTTSTPEVAAAATEKKAQKPKKTPANKQNKEKKQGVKRKQPEESSEAKETKETKEPKEKTDKKKNKNKKSKKAIKAAIKTFVLKLEIDNALISEEKVKECFPEQNAIIRMGPRLILVQFPTEEIALKYLTSESGQVEKNRRTVINGENFKITKHTVKEIFNPRWYDVKPRVTEGASLGLAPGQKVNGKFGPYLELFLKEKLGNEVNTSISDMEKGVTVFFDDKSTEEKLKAMVQSGEFKVPAEYINDKKKKGSKGPAKKKMKK